MFRKYSKIVMVVATVVLVSWDIYAYIMEENSTFSVIITDAAYYSPMLPFIVGALMGHWFWPAKGTKD